MNTVFVKYAGLLLANWQRALLGCIIVVSVIITLMGVLKKVAFDKIGNKLLRKFLLAFTSVLLSFPFTAVYFLADKINFDHYWIGACLNALATIVTYWLYENTLLRNFIHFVGKKTIIKFIEFIAMGIVSKKANSKEETVEQLNKGTQELKSTVSQAISSTLLDSITSASRYNEDDLKNL